MTDSIPINEVQALAAQGKSEREIVHELRSKGYSNENISKALSAAIKSSIETVTQEKPKSLLPPMPKPTPPQPTSRPVSVREATYALPPPPPMPVMREEQVGQTVYAGDETESIPMTVEEEIKLEELIEEMINDRWKPIEDIMVAWDKAIAVLQEKMSTMEQRLGNLESRHDTIREDIRGMLSTTTDHIDLVESRIGSVEKAFKEFLPALAENVRSLSSIVEKVKKQ